ncbi:MAG: alpha/beta fold hydrolase [Bacilli bacterium]|nr:alpha/beta fold hydrolase [Bacilli bacterium]
MYQIFEVVLPEGEKLKGCFWPAKKATHNLVMQTGMNEHASRYDALALYLNEAGVSVSILDAFGQGENAASIEEQERWPRDAFRKNVDAMHLRLEEVKKNGLPTIIMGHSMGSFMTQSYAERYPNTADKIVLFGTNGPTPIYGMAKLLGKMLVHKGNWDKPNKFLSNLALGGYTKAIKDRKTDLDWLSFDEKNVADYIADPYCGHINTGGFLREFFIGLATLYKKKNLANISKDTPIAIMAGEEDPVGASGKGPRDLAKMYEKLGVKKVHLKLYPHMRHEIHNEIGKEQVWADLKDFLLS